MTDDKMRMTTFSMEARDWDAEAETTVDRLGVRVTIGGRHYVLTENRGTLSIRAPEGRLIVHPECANTVRVELDPH